MSTLSTSVQVITKNKSYYLKTNLGLMKIRGEVLTATQLSILNSKIKKKLSRNVRAASETGEYRNIHVVSTYSEQVLAHSSSRSTGIPVR